MFIYIYIYVSVCDVCLCVFVCVHGLSKAYFIVCHRAMVVILILDEDYKHADDDDVYNTADEREKDAHTK